MVSGVEFTPVRDQPTSYSGQTSLQPSSDPAVAAEQALLDLYWDAVAADSTERLYYSGASEFLPPEVKDALMAVTPASKSVAEVAIIVDEATTPLMSGCVSPRNASTSDMGRLRRAAYLGSPTEACKLAAILEQDLEIDVAATEQGETRLSVSQFTDNPQRTALYLEASYLRVFAWNQNSNAGMKHTSSESAER